ncbi:hypothetical protein BZG02_05885 [Labilibaculum filiforme]|uniref:Uncharacterized protein n=1 Tax=Labilibaculum filiforme TaxID=1940526 RepID=A0A2N3I209_9BACT|nr:hypothetical protein [Labilibaculum filiforme]PKQ64346.1 hypothetical protein BZG02_05885 [Labilibaculum filiforme]
MNDVYTLLKLDRKNTRQDRILLMDRIASSNVFESADLVEYLDKFKVKSQKNLLQRILGFRQSTKNVNLNCSDIAEITLN